MSDRISKYHADKALPLPVVSRGSHDTCQPEKSADRSRLFPESFLARTVPDPEMMLRRRANQERRTSRAFGSLAASDVKASIGIGIFGDIRCSLLWRDAGEPHGILVGLV